MKIFLVLKAFSAVLASTFVEGLSIGFILGLVVALFLMSLDQEKQK